MRLENDFSLPKDLRQICLNGHIGKKYALSQPSFNRSFCEKCGSKNITDGPNEECGAAILGGNFAPVEGLPSYCRQCGKPFPWVGAKLAALREVTDLIEGLSDREREALKKSFDDLVADTPRTSAAVMRFRAMAVKVGPKAGSILYEGTNDILSDFRQCRTILGIRGSAAGAEPTV